MVRSSVFGGRAPSNSSPLCAATTYSTPIVFRHDGRAVASGLIVVNHDRNFAVPLNAEAAALIRKRLGRHQTHVFSFRGRPITQVSTKAWYAALEKAGIEDFRWHDLRHTWASWHVQQGTPLSALQEMGGWESPEMARRYAHLTAEHLAPYADRLCALRAVEAADD